MMQLHATLVDTVFAIAQIDITSFVLIHHIQWQEWQSACRSSATIEKSSVLPYKELPQPSCASEIKEITPCGAIPIKHFTVLWSLYFDHVCALGFRLFGL